MIAGSGTLNYFLFPHMTFSNEDLRTLSIFLPRVYVMETVRPVSIPQWAQDRFSGWSVLQGDYLAARIVSCLEGYRNFAQVHGGPGGILGFLNVAFDEIDEPRYSIQEELRGKCRQDMDQVQKETIQAALFLEIARELDEKELEIESGYANLSAIEQEFREIVGIDDEDSESAEAHLAPPLTHDTNGLLYMLPKRIESWFRLFSRRPVHGRPVFVAGLPEVVEEALEMIRAGCDQNGKEFSTSEYSLGSIPDVGKLGQKQFQTLIEAPGMPELLSACHSELEDLIKAAAGGEGPAELQTRSKSSQSVFERLCGKCTAAGGGKANLSLAVVESVSLGDAAGFFGVSDGFTVGEWPPVFLSIQKGD